LGGENLKSLKFAVAIFLIVLFVGCTKQENPVVQKDPDLPVDTEIFEQVNLVESGRVLFSDTSLGTNGKSCQSCHEDPAILSGAAAGYITTRPDMTLKESINLCITDLMDGQALANYDERLLALEAYLLSL
jgi:hypothetical protein